MSAMTTTEDKIVQYLNEARAMELALVRTLQAHIAMTPSGGYRRILERHLRETRDHADRVGRRLSDLDAAPTVAGTVYGIGQQLAGQLLALGKAPLDVLRGASAEEKLLKNAKDECATEALEIATYDALEQLALRAGDKPTARLAADHRADEERMLRALRQQLPALTDAVVGAEVDGRPTFDAGRTGAAQTAQRTVRDTERNVSDAVQGTTRAVRRAAADTRRAAAGAVDDAAGAARAAIGSSATSATTEEREEQRQPFARYDELNADRVVGRLDALTPAQLRHVATYERAHKHRRTVLEAAERKRGGTEHGDRAPAGRR
ncbi:hypothetical protein Cwoe_3460 [Conexibacter woesei DSM 14684]|uniref:Uncharacterized protein n=2 Tax=Conexibacter TaxID=191494 RepID=D3EZB3_CONWI|nr:hypothetical protein Cwoe_3460 [Conexibacter woesei DSM 14684]